VGEPVQLQVDDDQAPQAAMEEQEVDPIPAIPDAQPALPPHEGEVATELQQEGFDLGDQRCFEVGFGVLVLQPEELEHVGVLDLLLGRDSVACLPRLASSEHRRLVPGQRGALIELRTDLAIELADGPAPSKSFGLVEPPRLHAAYAEEAHVV
jgi:hypothetical protein